MVSSDEEGSSLRQDKVSTTPSNCGTPETCTSSSGDKYSRPKSKGKSSVDGKRSRTRGKVTKAQSPRPRGNVVAKHKRSPACSPSPQQPALPSQGSSHTGHSTPGASDKAPNPSQTASKVGKEVEEAHRQQSQSPSLVDNNPCKPLGEHGLLQYHQGNSSVTTMEEHELVISMSGNTDEIWDSEAKVFLAQHQRQILRGGDMANHHWMQFSRKSPKNVHAWWLK